MTGKLAKEVENEIDKTGYHILKKSFAKNNKYPNPFPDFEKLDTIDIGSSYTLRLFVKVTQNNLERIESGMIDVKIFLQSGDKYTGEILTQLPPVFPLRKGQKIVLTEDEILFKQG